MEISAPVPPLEPIFSLRELRQQHSALLQRQSAGLGTTKPTHGEVLGFLEAASQLGRQLEFLEERDSAQSIMDYWLATVLSESPELTQTSNSLTLFPFSENGYLEFSGARELTQQRAANAAENTQQISAKLDNEQTQTLQRLLLRFLRLKENALEAYSVPLTDNDEFLKDPVAKNLLAQLIDAGAVRQRAAETSNAQVYELAHDRLIFEWDSLQKVAEQRRAFRSVALGWNRGERGKEVLLLGGKQLREAGDYQDLNPLEREFYNASRRATDKSDRFKLVVISSLLATALLGLALLGYQFWKINQAQNETEEINTKLTKALSEKEQILLDMRQAYAISETTTSQILSIRDQVDQYKVEIPTGNVREIVKRAVIRAKSNQRLDIEKPMFEFFVPVTVSDPEKTFSHYIEAIKEAGFEIPAAGPLPMAKQNDNTRIRYFHPEDLPLAQKIERILRQQNLPGDFDPPYIPKLDGKEPKKFIQISIGKKAFPTPSPQPQY